MASSLFSTGPAGLASTGSVPASVADPAPAISHELMLSLPADAERGTLIFSLSFCRWLLAAFEQVELLAEPPSPAEWGTVSREFMGREMAQPGGFEINRPFRVEENLRLHFTDSPMDAPPPVPLRDPSKSSTDWALLPHQNFRPGRIVVRAVQADPSPSLLPCVQRTSLWVALLPAGADAFMRYYLLIKSARSLTRTPPKFFAVLDRSGSDHDLKKIGIAWDTVTERFLGWSVPILGQVDFSTLAADDSGIGRKVRVCEETLGPPWPSDLQAHCQAAPAPRIIEASRDDEGDRSHSAAADLLHAEACRPG